MVHSAYFSTFFFFSFFLTIAQECADLADDQVGLYANLTRHKRTNSLKQWCQAACAFSSISKSMRVAWPVTWFWPYLTCQMMAWHSRAIVCQQVTTCNSHSPIIVRVVKEKGPMPLAMDPMAIIRTIGLNNQRSWPWNRQLQLCFIIKFRWLIATFACVCVCVGESCFSLGWISRARTHTHIHTTP